VASHEGEGAVDVAGAGGVVAGAEVVAVGEAAAARRTGTASRPKNSPAKSANAQSSPMVGLIPVSVARLSQRLHRQRRQKPMLPHSCILW